MKTTLTKPTRANDITRVWHLVDVKNKVLGRIVGDIAHTLMGKGKPYFVKNLDWKMCVRYRF